MKIDFFAKYVVLFWVLFFMSCSSFSPAERFEGFSERKNVFRVYVKIDAYEFEDFKVQNKINEKLIEAAYTRFSELITVIASGMENKDQAGELNLFVIKKEVKPELVYRRISEERIESFADFNIPEKYAAMILQMLSLPKSGSIENE